MNVNGALASGREGSGNNLHVLRTPDYVIYRTHDLRWNLDEVGCSYICALIWL